MKIYLTNYDLSKRADKTIYASQYSSFKAGIKVPGASDIKLFDGQTEISADASLFHGYKAFPLDAGDAGQKEYTIKADGAELKLKVVSTESTAAELNDKDTVFDLPAATADTLGGIKVGANLTIGADGTLSASGGSIPKDLSVDNLYSAHVIKLADPDSLAGIYVNCDPNSQTYATVRLPNFSYYANSERGEANIALGDISMGGGFRLDESMGSLTCQIMCQDLTATYVSTGQQFYAPAIAAQYDNNTGHQSVVIGDEYNRNLYVKYDEARGEMNARISQLTCIGTASFTQLTCDGTAYFQDLTVNQTASIENAIINSLAVNSTLMVGSGDNNVFAPITVTIDGTQYTVLGHPV